MSIDFVAVGQRVLAIESRALADLVEQIDDHFSAACALLLACSGRVIVTGMGKSGHIGNKLAATFASTGTPAFFVHPAEASHGDLGMITRDDTVIALSNSGETAEVLTIVPLAKRKGASLISITGKANSTLARLADVHLLVAVREEACPHNLAPTSSTTAALAMGDALAIALLEARGFTANDFALSHPGGTLGRRLLLTVDDVMHGGERLPQVAKDANLASALLEMTRKGLGMTCIVDTDQRLLGIFTDGDLRRLLEQDLSTRNTPITAVMQTNPITIAPGKLAAEALEIMDHRKINGLIVCDAGQRPLGALNMHDLLRAGVV